MHGGVGVAAADRVHVGAVDANGNIRGGVKVHPSHWCPSLRPPQNNSNPWLLSEHLSSPSTNVSLPDSALLRATLMHVADVEPRA